jgi:hypothetical protein
VSSRNRTCGAGDSPRPATVLAAQVTAHVLRKLLGERFHGYCLVVFHIEDGVELGDLEQIVDLLGEVEQLKFAALVLGGGECADQFADA